MRYDYLVHPTLHLGCALEAEQNKTDDEQMQSFAEDLQATDSGHRPS